jgi:hypothetical protein
VTPSSERGQKFDYSFGYRVARLFIIPVHIAFPFIVLIVPSCIDYLNWKYFGAEQVVYVRSWFEVAMLIPLPLLLALGTGWLFMIAAAARVVIWHSPIRVAHDRLKQYIFGMPLRSICFEEITKLEKIRKWHSGLNYYYNEVAVITAKRAICFRDYINEYGTLADILNKLILQRKIPLEFVDRGPDSIRRLSTASERRQAQKLGIRRTVAQL